MTLTVFIADDTAGTVLRHNHPLLFVILLEPETQALLDYHFGAFHKYNFLGACLPGNENVIVINPKGDDYGIFEDDWTDHLFYSMNRNHFFGYLPDHEVESLRAMNIATPDLTQMIITSKQQINISASGLEPFPPITRCSYPVDYNKIVSVHVSDIPDISIIRDITF